LLRVSKQQADEKQKNEKLGKKAKHKVIGTADYIAPEILLG
jgi:hypothetical protein